MRGAPNSLKCRFEVRAAPEAAGNRVESTDGSTPALKRPRSDMRGTSGRNWERIWKMASVNRAGPEETSSD